MFRDKTTFVIGAGASAEFNLPVGSGLANNIKASALLRLDDYREKNRIADDFFCDAVTMKFRTPAERKPYLDALKAINEGIYTAVSIDAFIHRNRGSTFITEMGKALIALEIAKAERGSLMHMSRREEQSGTLDRKELEDTWIGPFFRTMADGVEDPAQLGKGVTIICFNYDRCIEFYLREAIHKAYRVERRIAQDIVDKMNIIHPYGTLGKLPWNFSGVGDGKLHFGPELDSYFELFEVGQNIRTYTEQAHDAEEVKKIHDAMFDCQNLIFLGFGFNNQNLDLLRIRSLNNYLNPALRNIYTTGVGIYPQANDTVTRRILDLYLDRDKHVWWKDRVHIENHQGCKELFSIHGMNFSSFTQHVIDASEPISLRSGDGLYVGAD